MTTFRLNILLIVIGVIVTSSVYWFRIGNGVMHTKRITKDLTRVEARIAGEKYCKFQYSDNNEYVKAYNITYRRERAFFPLYKEVVVDTVFNPILTKD